MAKGCLGFGKPFLKRLGCFGKPFLKRLFWQTFSQKVGLGCIFNNIINSISNIR